MGMIQWGTWLLLALSQCGLPYASCRPGPCRGCLPLHGYQANGSTAHVANASDPNGSNARVPTVTLRQALADPAVTTIVLLSNYLAEEFADNAHAIHLDRNVTITAPDERTLPLLDFNFVRSALHLCSTCVFHMRHISIANERRGNGAAIDFFVGDPGSVVKLEDSLRVRLACTTTDSTMELIHRGQPRSPRNPLTTGTGATNATQAQVLSRRNVNYLGRTYTDMLLLVDFSYDVPPSFQEGRGMVGGFTMRTINTTRLCRTTIDPACLKVKGPDVCVNEAIDRLMSSEGQQMQAAPQPGGAQLVVVVAPVAVVAGLLGASSLAMWVLCVRRRRLQQQESGCHKSQPSGTHAPGSSRLSRAAGSNSSSSSSRVGGGSGDGSDKDGGGAGPVLVGDQGLEVDTQWEVAAVGTSPSLGSVGNRAIHLGRMIGAGGFGVVFKGRWAGRQVAVKCIEHDAHTSKAVENEVRLMLSIEHPNVVKALHYVTYRHAANSTTTDDGQGRGDGGRAAAAAAGAAGRAAAAACGVQELEQLRQGDRQVLHQLRCRDQQAGLTPRQRQILAMHRSVAGFSSCDNSTSTSTTTSSSSSTSSAAATSLVALSAAVQQPPAPHNLQQQHQQQEEGTCNLVVVIQPDGGGGGSHPATPSSLHSSAVVSGSPSEQLSHPKYRQPLTPDQKMQLHVHQLRQQYLLQKSGMHVRSPVSLPSPLPRIKGGGRKARVGGCGTGQNSSDRDAHTPPRQQDQQHARTYIVQEFCDLGTLTAYVRNTLPDPSDREQMVQLLILLMDAARGIAVLHSKSVVHGDVNARNVLVASSSTAPYGAVAKLADLGLSRVIRQQATHKTTRTVGTLSHMPPEVLRHGHMSAAMDVWAFGMMMWELFTAQPVFKDMHYGQFFECIVLQKMRPVVPGNMPQDYRRLMLSCWATAPPDRPSAQQLLDQLQAMLGERQCAGAAQGS